MVVGAAMGKIEANHVDAGTQHLLQDPFTITGGPEGGNDLGTTYGGMRELAHAVLDWFENDASRIGGSHFDGIQIRIL